MTGDARSRSTIVRDEAAKALVSSGRPMHYKELAVALESILKSFERPFSPKDLNTALHGDPQRRFTRVGKGAWQLK